MHFLDNSWKLTLSLILLRAYLEVLGSCGSSSVTWILSVRLWTNALNRAERPSFPLTSSLKSWKINYAHFHTNAEKQKGGTTVMQNQSIPWKSCYLNHIKVVNEIHTCRVKNLAFPLKLPGNSSKICKRLTTVKGAPGIKLKVFVKKWRFFQIDLNILNFVYQRENLKLGQQ